MIELGANRLVGSNPGLALAAALDVLDGAPLQARVPELWDGFAGGKIVEVLDRRLA